MTSSDGHKIRLDIEAAWRVCLEASGKGPLHYLQHAVIDCKPEPMPYRQKAEPWQWALAQRYSPAFAYVAGAGPKPAKLNYWTTMPKGHDKSSFIARMTNWSLAFARKTWTGYVAAADKEQAGYLAEAMRTEAAMNPWLNKRLSFGNFKIEGQNGSMVKILAADAAGSQGIRPDLMICDEITHWTKPDLYNNLKSGVAKKDCVLIVITNAGVKFSWQWDEVEYAKTSPLWYVYEAPGPLASWMDQKRIEDSSRTLPPIMARRLFRNEWVDPGEASGYLTRWEIEKGVETGKRVGAEYALLPKPGVRYVAAIDYGAVRDRCVMVVTHMENEDNTVVVDRMEVVQGNRERPVSIELVERWIDEVRKTFPLDAVIVDPYQMESTIQRYQGSVPIERWEPRGGKANYEMAQCFRTCLVNGRLGWYQGAGSLQVENKLLGGGILTVESFEDELMMLQLKQMAYGFRVDHLPGKHDDRFVAVAMAATHLVQNRLRKQLPQNDEWF